MTQATLTALLAELENHPHPTIELKLERMQHFLDLIGNPERAAPPIIHVAGTNGKGSVIAFMHAIIEQSGLKAHRYTSPHLVRFNERFILANKEIDDDTLIAALQTLRKQQETCPLTYFESATALAFSFFAAHKADATLLEVGLGGRYDASNVITSPLATVITPIAMDHQAFLGDTLAAIAAEKAAIIKHNTPCIIGKQKADALAVINDVAKNYNAPLWRYGHEWEFNKHHNGSLSYSSNTLTITTPAPSLIGEHQYENAATAIAVMDHTGHHLGITQDGIKQGVTNTHWAGRLQHLKQEHTQTCWNTHHSIYLDGGHNPHAAQAISDWTQHHERPVHLICGIRDDKDASEVMRLMTQHTVSVTAITIPDEPQALDATTLQNIIAPHYPDVGTASSLQAAITNLTMTNTAHHSILIAGSLYLVGAALQEVQR